VLKGTSLGAVLGSYDSGPYFFYIRALNKADLLRFCPPFGARFIFLPRCFLLLVLSSSCLSGDGVVWRLLFGVPLPCGLGGAGAVRWGVGIADLHRLLC